eukprot:gene3145-2127_t
MQLKFVRIPLSCIYLYDFKSLVNALFTAQLYRVLLIVSLLLCYTTLIYSTDASRVDVIVVCHVCLITCWLVVLLVYAWRVNLLPYCFGDFYVASNLCLCVAILWGDYLLLLLIFIDLHVVLMVCVLFNHPVGFCLRLCLHVITSDVACTRVFVTQVICVICLLLTVDCGDWPFQWLYPMFGHGWQVGTTLLLILVVGVLLVNKLVVFLVRGIWNRINCVLTISGVGLTAWMGLDDYLVVARMLFEGLVDL